MIFLIRPPIAPTRARNHTDKALSGCQRNHIHASSTIASRTRLLPSFPMSLGVRSPWRHSRRGAIFPRSGCMRPAPLERPARQMLSAVTNKR